MGCATSKKPLSQKPNDTPNIQKDSGKKKNTTKNKNQQKKQML